jgi:hypothetical protein
VTGKLHYLAQGDLAGLFIEELGWDHPRGRTDRTVTIDGVAYPAKPVAEKAGVVVLRVPDPLDAAARDQVKRELRRHYAESLAVFVDDSDRVTFEWTEDRASGTKRRVTHTFVPGRANTALLERLTAISFDGDRPNPTVVEVRGKLAQTFTVDRVTRDFYRKYDTHHKKVTAAIQGIPGEEERRWYTSILLNRLMFVYFLQKRGFLDGNVNYLRNRFDTVRATHGEGQYQTFFRAFLRHLFLTGLGEKPERRDRKFTKLIGDVPYVNGGLFSQHEIEARHEAIDIPDTVFDALFTFLDSYQWHLDDRPLADERTINPDVLGYIFEQYINQKEQGAYYTKEDVTGYMCRHTILPWVLDRAAALAKDQSIEFNPWPLLTKNPYRYLPESLLHGTRNPLPPDVDLDGEQGFQRSTGDEDPLRLPTESWLECWARRGQADTAFRSLSEGHVVEPNAAVTLNVDLQRLLADYAAECADEPVLVLLWEAILGCTTLDPTCGSGAFLFAALQVLEDAAEVVFARLDVLVSDSDRLSHPVLGPASAYSSSRYWLRKHIILHTLYGVDLMAEATEVAKLRLFLALMSHVHRREDFEPLPDLDFNIRAGNAVVGYVAPTEATDDLESMKFSLFGAPAVTPTDEQVAGAMKRVQYAYTVFVASQRENAAREEHVRLKRELKAAGDEFRNVLDAALAAKKCSNAKKRRAWVSASQPFHWIAEFPQVLLEGGFSVVAGNPPYLRLGKLDRTTGTRALEVKNASGKKVELYMIDGFATASCPDLYAPVMERAADLTSPSGRYAMIVMLSASFSSDFAALRSELEQQFNTRWVSTYAKRPALLFPGVQVRNTIFVGSRRGEPTTYTTRCHRWSEAARPHLFGTIGYAQPGERLADRRWPTVGDQTLADYLEGLCATGQTLGGDLVAGAAAVPVEDGLFGTTRAATEDLLYKSNAYNFLSVFRSEPPSTDVDGNPVASDQVKKLAFSASAYRDAAFALLAGKIAFSWWLATGGDFNVAQEVLSSFPMQPGLMSADLLQAVVGSVPELERAMNATLAHQRTTVTKAGVRRTLLVGRYDLSKCRVVTDKTDRLIAGTSWRAIQLLYAQSVRGVDDESETAEEASAA